MAGRRRSYAGVAAGLNILSRGVAADLQSQRKERESRATFVRDLVKQAVKSQQWSLNPQAVATMTSGGAVQGPLLIPGNRQQFNASLLGPWERVTIREPGGVTRTVTRPPAMDPALRANRMAQLQQRIQEIEQRNALAPDMARAARLRAYPNPTVGFGGYTENPPGIVGSLLGQHQRPPATAIPIADTTLLKNQLTALTGPSVSSQVENPPDPIAQRIHQLLQGGTPRDRIINDLRQKGIDPAQYGL